MSVKELKEEIRALSGDDRHVLSAFLVELELEQDETYWERVRRRISDDNPKNWIDVSTLK